MSNQYISEDGGLTNEAFVKVAQGLNIIQTACHARAVAKGWWPEGVERNLGEQIALMHSELSEALECYRNSEPYLWYKHAGRAAARYELERVIDINGTKVVGKPEGLASEFADVLIRIFDTCAALDIPLTDALMEKHEYNSTRSHRHGGKLA